MASIGTIIKKRPISMVMAPAVLYQSVLVVSPATPTRCFRPAKQMNKEFR